MAGRSKSSPAKRSESAPIEILIVEDHKMVAEGVASSLATYADFDVIGYVGTIADALNTVENQEVDVVLMDFQLPDGDGVSATETILAINPGVKVVMVTAHEEPHLLRAALRAGCAGYVFKSAEIAEVVSAIRAAHAGSTAIAPELLARMMLTPEEPSSRVGPDELSPRELDVLRLLARGVRVEQISDQLFISASTVRNHIQSLLEKLDAHSQLEAVAKALAAGLVTAPQHEPR
jgi:DNA-binding NarL/FixJ family response regulator